MAQPSHVAYEAKIYGDIVTCYDLGLGSVLSQQTVLEPIQVKYAVEPTQVKTVLEPTKTIY